jgi:hypothetical protein
MSFFLIFKYNAAVFGDETSKFNYSVQLCSKNDLSQGNYMFGIYFFEKNESKEAHVYHNGHGPFKCFEKEYEKS